MRQTLLQCMYDTKKYLDLMPNEKKLGGGELAIQTGKQRGQSLQDFVWFNSSDKNNTSSFF